MVSMSLHKKFRHQWLSLAEYAKYRPFIFRFKYVANNILQVLFISDLKGVKSVVLSKSCLLQTDDSPFLLFLGHTAKMLYDHMILCYLDVMCWRDSNFSYLLNFVSVYHVHRLVATDHDSHPI
jgi:hypothetical protein